MVIAGIRDVERGPVRGAEMNVEEIHYRAIAHAVNDVAERAADDEADGDPGEAIFRRPQPPQQRRHHHQRDGGEDVGTTRRGWRTARS